MSFPKPLKVSVSESRARWAKILKKIAKADGLRVIIESYGHPVAVILHPEDVAVMDRIEDRFVEIHVKRLRAKGRLRKTKGAISFDEVQRQLAEDRVFADAVKAVVWTAAPAQPPATTAPRRTRKPRR